MLDVPGHPWVIHTPGHTPGHSALLFRRHGYLFAGDALCTENPIRGWPGPQVMPKPTNVDYACCFESLAALEAADAGLVLVGHGPPFKGSPADAVTAAREAAGAGQD